MSRASILVVEDEAIVALDLRQRLEAMGYRVAGVADTGASAVAQAVATRPDLVLMDIRLRGPMDGIEAARELRRRILVPVVYATAHSDAATLARAREGEPFGYVLKPYEDRDLETAIEIGLYRHGSERKLRQVEGWLSAALTSVGHATIGADTAGRVGYLNPLAEALTGWTQDEAAGRPLEEVFDARGRSGERLEGLVPRALREGVVISPETSLVGRAGARTDVDVSVSLARDATGVVQGVVVCLRLAGAPAPPPTRPLEVVGRLAGEAVEEFKDALTAVGGWVEVLLARADQPEGAREQLRAVQRANHRAAGLTRQLLAYARKQELDPRVVNLEELVRDLLPVLRRLAGDAIIVSTSFSPDLGRVEVDPTELELALVSLATNACQALPEGGRLSLEVRERVVSAGNPAGVEPGRYAVLALTDTGRGMDPSVLARAVEPYFTTHADARGLGLSAVEGVARQAGGGLAMSSERGRGTRVELLLPVVGGVARAPGSSPPAARIQVAAVRGAPAWVLVVDDDLDVRTFLETALDTAGLVVRTAASGQEGLRSALEGPVDLLLTDVTMDDLGGRQLGRLVRVAHPAAAVLFMSGHSYAWLIQAGALEPGSLLLTKPFTLASLLAKIHDALEGAGVSRGPATSG